MNNVVNVTEENFEEHVTNSELPVLVDFYGTTCAPCKVIAPLIESAADEYAGKLKVVKVNVQDSAKLGMKYMVRSIPTLYIFKNGNIASQPHVGVITKQKLDSFINNSI